MKLRLPAVRQPGTQEPIWDWVGNIHFYSMAQTRNATGDFCEEATKTFFGGERMTTDGQADICPDIRVDDKHYLEVKSVQYKRTALVYEHILERAQRFVRRNRVQLHYVFWLHNTRAAETENLFELRRQMATDMNRVIVVPFEQVVEATTRCKIRIMNYRAPERDGKEGIPMRGWALPNAQLRAWSTGQPSLAFEHTVYGFPMGGFPVYHSKG